MALNWCTVETELWNPIKNNLSVQEKVLTLILTIPQNTQNFNRQKKKKKKKKSVLKVTKKIKKKITANGQ